MDNKYTTEQQLAELQKEMNNARARMFQKKGGRPGGKKMWGVLGWVVFAVLVLGLGAILTSVLIAKSSGKTPAVFGYQLYVVQSGSMEPTFNVGTIILSKIPDDPAALQKGDVVTFTNGDMTITHRIVEVITDGGTVKYKTKGDNPENSVDPDFLTVDRVKAVLVFRVPLT